ncbi:MAG TPA: D-alanine--D-alanine ligase [Candidatus Pullichristensenella excrementipullorum]|nr:D-alanine--D-alanine ligase [Candidatus Pullichristensenella excrementipullorum]
MYNIGVIYGSRTCEHDVSIISALQAAQALDTKNYNITYIYIGREGTWYTGEALADVKFYEHFDAAKLTRVLPAGENGKLVLYHLPEKKKLFGGAAAERVAVLDVVMPVLHGLNGEDGTLQGMLELFDVPYTSAGVMGSAVGMDKITMKLLFKGCGFPVIEGVWFDRGRWSRERDGVMDECEDKLGFPLIVKPANLGSSIGINIAHDRNQLEDAIETAAAYDHRILVEKAVSPLREVNCSVLGYGDHVETSELEMPVTKEEFLTFRGKYMCNAKGAGGMASQVRLIPAPISEQAAQTVRDLAVRAFRAMDLKGVVRIDFILDENENVFINEANTIPGSLAFYLWEPKGVSFSALLDGMVECAFSAWADRKASVFSHDSTLLANIVHGSKGAKGKLSH